jgi:hypothetical protein
MEVSRPIRAGILFGVDSLKLKELIIELLICLDGPDKFSLETQSSRADIYIGIISGADKVELLDNCFWGDGTMHRGRWVPYQWNKSKHRSNHGVFIFLIYIYIYIFNCRLTGLAITDAKSTPPGDHDPPIVAALAPGEQPPRDATTADTDTAAAAPGEPSGDPADTDVTTDADIVTAEPLTAEVVPVYSLTDPDTWRKILNHGFREKRSLTYMWKNDLAPLIGVPYPFGETKFDDDTLEKIATHMRALGLALKDYTFHAEGMLMVMEHLHHCCDLTVETHIKNIEYALFFEQKGKR